MSLKIKNNINSELHITHNDNTQAITVSSEELSRVKTVNTIADLKSISNPPPTVWVSGYHDKGDGAFGSNIFEWDSTSTDADNGGTIIEVTGIVTGRYKLRYDGAVNVKWFGANVSLADNQVIIQAIINSFYKIYIPSGVYTLLSSITIPQGVEIIGDARQSYGSYSSAIPSTLYFSGLPADDWCVDIPINSENINLRSLNILGDWNVNGINYMGANREMLLEDISIKGMKFGVSTNDFWVSNFVRVAIQCTGTGVQFLNGGTTNKLELFLEGKSDASTADRMDIGFSTVGEDAKLFNTTITGFCQKANTGMNFSVSPQVDVNNFDFENVLRCVELYNLDEARIKFNSCTYYLISTATAFRISGVFSDLAQVYINGVQGLTDHFSGKFASDLDWTTEKFLESNAATFANGLGVLEIDYHTYDTVMNGTTNPTANAIDADVLPHVKVRATTSPAVSEWTDYTPTLWNGTSVVIGSASGRYKVDGDLITVEFTVNVTSSAADTSAVEITVPHTPAETMFGSIDWQSTTFFGLSTLGDIKLVGSGFGSVRCFEAVTGSAYTYTESNGSGIINGTVTYKV